MGDLEKKLAAVERWSEKYPTREIRDLGFNLLDIAKAASGAQIQLQQAIANPARAREAEEAIRAFDRLNELIDRFNAEVHQLRTGRWPEDDR